MKELGGAGQGYNGITIVKTPGWWCNNHLEKYEFVNGKDYPIYEMENKQCLKPPTSYSSNSVLAELHPKEGDTVDAPLNIPILSHFLCGNFSDHVSYCWIFCRVHHITMQWFALFSHILYLWVKNQVKTGALSLEFKLNQVKRLFWWFNPSYPPVIKHGKVGGLVPWENHQTEWVPMLMTGG